MGQIIIFEYLKHMALSNDLTNLVLFGEKNFVNDGKNIYDLIFHSKKIINPYDKEKPCSLVIPVLNASNDKEAIDKISSLYEIHRDFKKFAVPGKEYLDFYEIIPKRLGFDIDRMGKYKVVGQEQLIKFSENPFFEQILERKIREIDNNYQ